MRLHRSIVAAASAVVLIGAAAAPPAEAQRVAVRRPVVAGPSVVVSASYRPAYYGAAFYGPWFGFGYAWYPGPYYPYYRPYYGYPYYPSYGYPYYYAPAPYDVSGSLRLQVTPRAAEVFVDGYYAGTVDDFDGVFQRLHVEPGEHDLELYLPGYRSVRQQLYLQPGRTSNVRLDMDMLAPGDPDPVRPSGTATAAPRRSAGPRRDRGAPVRPVPSDDVRVRNAANGRISLRVQPGDATVLIDGEEWKGPATDERLVVELAPGPHMIEIVKDGYRRHTTEIIVRAGETATLNVALTRQ